MEKKKDMLVCEVALAAAAFLVRYQNLYFYFVILHLRLYAVCVRPAWYMFTVIIACLILFFGSPQETY